MPIIYFTNSNVEADSSGSETGTNSYNIVPYVNAKFSNDAFLNYSELGVLYDKAIIGKYPLFDKISSVTDPPYFVVDPKDIRMENEVYRCSQMIIVNQRITDKKITYKLDSKNAKIIREYRHNIFCVQVTRSK